MKKHTSDNLSSDTIGGDVELGVGLTANTDDATSPDPTASDISFSIDAAEKHTNDGYKATNRDSSEITDGVKYDSNGEIMSRVARAPTFYPQYMGGMQPDSESDALVPDHHHRHRSFSFSAMAPTNAPVVLVWKDLSVLTKTKPPKVLLNNISGQITGGFWAIMGSSGGGKTTLLSTISLRLDSSKMETIGTIRLNGNEYSTAVLKAMSAYVLQDDLLHAELTVKETIKYAADLRLSGKMDDKGRKQRQKDVIALMGIEHISDTIIGDTRRKGISGGERKRVCVAIELLTAPKLMFLDEPTSGLDSTTALSVCNALKNLTVEGICTVICTIHQPQKKIFELFDNLILMKKGQIVYQGACAKSLLFLEMVGRPCPAETNPADFLLEAISYSTATSSSSSVSNEEEGCNSFQEGKGRLVSHQDLSEAFDENARKEVPVDLMKGMDKTQYKENAPTLHSWWTQFKILFVRCGTQYIRRLDIIFMNLVLTIILSIFVSCGVWYQIGTSQTSIAKRTPSLFFAAVSQGIVASLQTIANFPMERAIILRERAAGSYHVSAYFIAKTCVDFLTTGWGTILFCAIVYPTIGYQQSASKFFIYWVFMLLDTNAALSLATMISCLCVSLELSTVVLSLLLELSRLYGGFFTSPKQLDLYENWRFADALSYLKYVFVGVAINELEDLNYSCTDAEIAAKSCIRKGEQTMERFGYDQYTIGFCAGILVVYIVGCRLVAYLALRFIKQ